MSQSDRRCPSCGALVSAEAEWCGQCFRPLRDASALEPAMEVTPTEPTSTEPPVAEPPVSEPAPSEPGPLTATEWGCPTCQHRNPLAATACEVCGTPFGRLFAEPEPEARIAPARALAWSLLLPGLGHVMAGRRPEGVTRIVLFAWTFGTVVLMLAARSGAGGLGPTAPLFWLFVIASAALYASSAVDAWRIASGRDPIVRPRTLLWAVVGLVVVSALLAALLAAGVSRGG